MPLPRIYADFHNADPLGRVRLNCVGTMRDLADQGVRLLDDLAVELYSEDLVIPGEVRYSAEEGIWVALIDWNQLHVRPEPNLDSVTSSP